ncbi:NmrA family NAD(P)-binding protein [Mycolicibacterium grossiae]|uniref:NmrA family transcriptional regulator n=1 Tax=Mycolicibacterium grossiae TaxID=1552759 RepID=A0A1E8QA52_9MYCO|nr:NAD(P)H-binding protein [Mycolicibacterium grossiae]OFJ54889.1 NmrA family transcriptional regulator [Mycolicibacterium grossiae]QEM44575.1 NAD(P)H-binding protein [Mycolicibacterium grossiae]
MTSKELFLVTGATGKTGSHVVRMLRELGLPVRAMVHRADARSETLAELGADVVQGDLLDLDRVSAAMKGVRAAYFCYPIDPGGLLDATTIFAQAASDERIDAVVNMSQISARREAGSHAARHHWLGERLLDRFPFVTTHLRPTFFAEWLIWQWSRDSTGGVLRLPFADGRHAPISAVDQARVITSILRDPVPHDRAIYRLVGPVEKDHHQIAREIGDALGEPVRYESVGIDAFAEALRAQGNGEFLIQHLTNVAQDYRDGVFAGADDTVEVLSGAPAATVRAFVEANRQAFAGEGQERAWRTVLDR